MIFLFFRPVFFKKEKKRACYILMFFSTESLFKMKPYIIQQDFAAESKIDVFKMFFMVIRLRNFHDNLNIVAILALGGEFFSGECAQFPLTSTI